MADPSRPSGPSNPSRPTGPPPLPRGEDSPPGVYRELPAHTIKGEPIARIAMRAPVVTPPDAREELLRALAATEGRMLTEISDRREAEEARQVERQRLFEAQMAREIQKLVIREVQSIPPPPAPPPPAKSKFEWTHLQYVGGALVALTGLIVALQNCQKPSAAVIALTAAQAETNKKIDLHIESEKAERLSDYEYKLSVRSWVIDVFERAASVKADDPPGTPKREQLGFYPPPKIDPHKVTGTHIVQPRDPYPVPPPPPP